MASSSSSSHPFGTIEEFCETHAESDVSRFADSTRLFLNYLGLSTSHPFCHDLVAYAESRADVPPSGPLGLSLLEIHDYNLWETAVTLYTMFMPSYLGFAELLIHTFSVYVVPIAFAILIRNIHVLLQQQEKSKVTPRVSSLMKVSTFASGFFAVYGSLNIMTGSMNVLEFGMLGLALYLISVLLTMYACKLSRSPKFARIVISFSLVVAFILTFDTSTNTFHLGFPQDVNVKVEPGLYYGSDNPFIKSVVEKYWPASKRTYNSQTGATPFLFTGDARTLLPYIFNKYEEVEWTRVYLPLEEEEEVLALDMAFPEKGHDFSKPIYVIFHGINSASDAGYAHDLARRQTAAGSTVIVLVARGYAELPLKGWNLFHCARVSDIHYATSLLRNRTMFVDPNQSLVGIGYSVGAIILPNYVALSGSECQLDAAFAVSGALDMRRQPYLHPRANRLWNSVVAHYIRMRHLAKWGHMIIHRLSKKGIVALLRSKHIGGFEEAVTIKYYGEDRFKDLEDYYSQTNVMGDIPLENFDIPLQNGNKTAMADLIPKNAKINQISIPMCVLHALDDPIIPWGFSLANEGILHPQNVVQTGSKNLLLLVTKTGGHVGWPVGWSFGETNWKWSNDAASSFFDAVINAKRQMGQEEETCTATNVEDKKMNFSHI